MEAYRDKSQYVEPIEPFVAPSFGEAERARRVGGMEFAEPIPLTEVSTEEKRLRITFVNFDNTQQDVPHEWPVPEDSHESARKLTLKKDLLGVLGVLFVGTATAMTVGVAMAVGITGGALFVIGVGGLVGGFLGAIGIYRTLFHKKSR